MRFEGANAHLSASAAEVRLADGSELGLAQVMATFLFGVTPRDPLVFVVVPLVLAIFAWLGVWLPARPAGRVDRVLALRVDYLGSQIGSS